MLIGPARGPNDDNHPTVKTARRDQAFLAVIKAIINPCRAVAREHLRGIGKIKPPVFQGRGALGRIKGDRHALFVTTKICNVKHLCNYIILDEQI